MNSKTQAYQAMNLHHLCRQTGRILCLSALLTLPLPAETTLSSDSDPEQLAKVVTESSVYTVVSGDSLSKIAQHLYGRAELWGAIFNANAGQLQHNPTAIYPGMQLSVPSLNEALTTAVVELSETEGAGTVTPEQAQSGNIRQPSANHAQANWLYTEGIARAIRREYMTFENAGRIAYLDPKLKEGDRVRKGQVLAYQEQSRTAASLASANAQVVSANTQLVNAQAQVTEANAQLVRAQTQVTVAEAGRAEADANLLLAKRTFNRYSVLLKQKSASQQEYDEAQARLAAAEAAVRRAVGQINAAKADVNVAKTGIAAAKAGVNTAKSNINNAKAGLGSAQVGKKESYLVAPIDGVVARINIEQGYYYSPQYLQTQTEQQVFNTAPIILIDPTRFEISLNLHADQYGSVRVGAEAYLDIIQMDASLEERLPDETKGPDKALSAYQIRGRIHSISPVLDTDLRNFIVTIRTTTGHQFLRDGESVSVWVAKGAAR